MKNQNTVTQENTIVLTAAQKRAATIEAKKRDSEALELEALAILANEEQQARDAVFDALESQQAAIIADKKKAFDTLETIDGFKVSLDLSRAAIESSLLADANNNISSEKRRLTAINRVNRCKRFSKMQSLSTDALSLISNNTDAVKIESTAIYAVDKVIQIARFLTGDSSIFGRGKNNSLMYLVRGIAVNEPQMITKDFAVNSLTRYGQPYESADTQASSSCKALLALNCVTMQAAGRYTVNQDSELMKLLIAEYK